MNEDFTAGRKIYQDEERPTYRRKREHKYKCRFCEEEGAREKYIFKKRRNFPHGKNAKGKVTLTCKYCGRIQ